MTQQEEVEEGRLRRREREKRRTSGERKKVRKRDYKELMIVTNKVKLLK
jgi:hypothetical protein